VPSSAAVSEFGGGVPAEQQAGRGRVNREGFEADRGRRGYRRQVEVLDTIAGAEGHGLFGHAGEVG